MDNRLSSIFSEAQLPPPDIYQEKVITNFLKENSNVCYIVNAAAGSGKTSLLNYLILALIKDAGVSPSQIATLTLNRKVASDLNKKVKESLSDSENIKVAYTFHSFANKFIASSFKEEPLLTENSHCYERNICHKLQNEFIYEKYVSDKEFSRLYDIISDTFLPDKTTSRNIVKNEGNKDLLLKLKDLGLEKKNTTDNKIIERKLDKAFLENHTLRGDLLTDELKKKPYFTRMVDIANRLFLKSILYELKIEKSDDDERAIFYISNDENKDVGDIIIEVTAKDNADDYFYENSHLVNYDNKNPVDWTNFNGELPVEQEDKKLNAFLAIWLNSDYKTAGITILGTALKYRQKDELLEELIKITERYRCSTKGFGDLEEFIESIRKSLRDYKKQNPSKDDPIKYKSLDALITVLEKFYDEVISHFTYTKLLELAANQSDELENKNVELKYLFIDEAQDLNSLFVKIIKRVIKTNKNLKILMVGDKAQAINRYIGAESTYVFPNKSTINFLPKDYKIKTFNLPITYRLDSALVNAVNTISTYISESLSRKGVDFSFNKMQYKNMGGKIALCEVKRLDTEIVDEIFKIVEDLYQENKDWKIALLSATNQLQNLGTDIHEIRRRILDRHRKKYKSWDLNIVASTIHKFKGLEADAVIILDANSGGYLIRNSPLHNKVIFGSSDETDYIDAACLYYTAITRAKHYLCFFAYHEVAKYEKIIRKIQGCEIL